MAVNKNFIITDAGLEVATTANVGTTLGVGGATTISNTLAVGNTSITGFVNVSSTANVGGTLTVGGLSTLSSGLNVTGTANATVGLNIGSNVNLSTSQVNVGNSSINAVVTATALRVSNSTAFTNVTVNGITTNGTLGVTGAVTLANTLGVTGAATFSNNVTVSGNFTVTGTTTYVNTTVLSIADNIITLNADVTDAPTENAGVEVNRGTSANVSLIWNETVDRWQVTNDGTTFGNVYSTLADVVLGTQTSGQYVGNIASISSAITVAGAGGEGPTVNLSLRTATTLVDGIVTLTDSTSNTTSGVAGSATAVKAAYDTAIAANTFANTASTQAIAANTLANTASTQAIAANTLANTASTQAIAANTLASGKMSPFTTGAGLTGSMSNTGGTLAVAAGTNGAIISNTSGIFVNSGNGLTTNATSLSVVVGNSQVVSNSTGVFINQTNIDHNALANYVANRHVDHSLVAISSGSGLTGGGDLTSSRTITVLANSGILANSSGTFANAGGGLVLSGGAIVVNGNSGITANTLGVFVNPGNGLALSGNTVIVNANTGIIANSTGVYANASYITSQAATNLISNNSVNGTYYIPLSSSATGVWSNGVVSDTQLTFNPGTGNMTVSNTVTCGTLVESSTIKIKENVVDLSYGLEETLKLRPVSYNRIGSTTREIGLIAEEVESIIPEAVDYDEFKSPSGVHYSRLVSLLIQAVQELEARVKELESK